MNRRISAGLVFLIVAGTSASALAQDHDHDGAHIQSTHGLAPGAPPEGSQSRGPVGSQSVRSEVAPGPTYPRQGPSGPGYPFQGHGVRGSTNGASGPQSFDRGPGLGEGGQRQYDRRTSGSGGGRDFEPERGPREGVPSGALGPGGARNFETHSQQAQPGVAMRNNPWGGGPGGSARWQPGRGPAVYWSHDRFHAGAYRQPYGYYVRSWAFGDILPPAWYVQNYWLDDFLDFGLPYPPPGAEWVRVGADALLIDRYSGRILQVVRGMFW